MSEFNVKLHLSDNAISQIVLILDNDYTLNNHYLRIEIGGKGCYGFTYQIGFSAKREDDLSIGFNYPELKRGFEIIMDPFTAYYCQEGALDYLLDHDTNQDGFVYTNAKESDYHGKFFKDPNKLPPAK